MSGNKFFISCPRTIDFNNGFMHGGRQAGNIPKKISKDFDFQSAWEAAWNQLQSNGYLEDSDLEMTIDKIEPQGVNRVVLTADNNSREIRMQEIEEYIVSNSIIRKIHGSLCIWNGHYYKQMNLQGFTQEVRKILPQSSQKRISRFSRFKEAYEYMLANDTLEIFTEKEMRMAENMIVFRNGMYDGKTGRVLASSSHYPVLFDIDAEYIGNGDLSTPYFDEIIDHATGGSREVLELCYQVLGYIFSQSIAAQKFIWIGTAPSSGKSQIAELLARMIGNDQVSSVSLTDFGNRFALGSINQKVLNYNMDLPAAELDKNAVQKLKQLTGDPRIDCEEKYVQSKTVVHHCKFLFASNHPLRLKYDDEAFWRRLLLIPFIYSVDEKERDYNLISRLWKERNAIATKAAHAYSRLLENNFVFQESSLAKKMLNEWREESYDGLLNAFFKENCEWSEANFLATDIVYNRYKEFCLYNGNEHKILDKTQFSRKFRGLFNLPMSKKRVRGYNSPVNGYVGIRLLER